MCLPDVDECVEEARPCEAEGQCVNNMGSYTCNCPQGYKQINGTSCVGKHLAHTVEAEGDTPEHPHKQTYLSVS